MSLPALLGLDRPGLGEVLAGLGQPGFRAEQVFRWMYGRGAVDFAGMSNVSKQVRTHLAASFSLARPTVVRDLCAADGTRKWLLALADGALVETVYIPDTGRGTLCVSSQVGCTLNCSFCHTGRQRLVRNLTAGEILAQVMVARDLLADWRPPDGRRRITNVVLMGMGEPLYNLGAVVPALGILTDDAGLAVSRRKVTVSTAGVVPGIAALGAACPVRLAVSLHAAVDEVRDVLVPLNRRYPLAELLTAVRGWPGLARGERITWEYALLAGVNDSPADARAVCCLIAGVASKVNLIPFNPWPGAPYSRPSDAVIARFAATIRAGGYPAPVRRPRGEDIMAACGQLRSQSVPVRRTAS